MSPHTGELRAVGVMARREFIRGTIENIKDQVRLLHRGCVKKHVLYQYRYVHVHCIFVFADVEYTGSLGIHTHVVLNQLPLLLQYGFILYHDQSQRNGGGEESIFFHMNSLSGSCVFSDLRPGDEVEFLMTYSQRTHKHSAIHVKKLR